MNHLRHTTVGTLQGFAAQALSLPTGLLTAAFLTRTLGPADYGLLTVAVSIVMFIELAITLGFNRAAVKYVAETQDWQAVASGVARALLLTSLVATALVYFLAPWLAHALAAPELTGYLRLFAWDIPLFTLANLHQAILVGLGRFGQRAILASCYWLSRMALIFLLVGLGFSIPGALLALMGASAVILIGARFFVRPPIWGRSAFPVRQVWNLTLPILLYMVGLNLFEKLDLMMVKALGDLPEAAGYYGAAQNLSLVGALFAASFSPLLLAKLSYLSREGRIEVARRLSQLSLRGGVCLLPLVGIAAGAAPELVVAIYGGPFLPAASLLSLLIFAALAHILNAVAGAMLISANRAKLALVLISPLLPLALLGHVVFVPRYGAIGAAAVTTALIWLETGVALLVAARMWDSRFPRATLLRNAFIGVITYAVAVLWPAPGLTLLLKLPVLALGAILALLLTGELSPAEYTWLRSKFNWRRMLHLVRIPRGAK